MFPPSLYDWLPDGHLARFLVDVVSALDLSAIYKSYQDKDGRVCKVVGWVNLWG
jgi:hypothetical protein